MTKKNVPVFVNDKVVGRAEIFDLDGTITITLHDPNVMPRLMSDGFRSLAIGWEEAVQPKPAVKIGDKVKSRLSGRIFDVVDVSFDPFVIMIKSNVWNRGMWVRTSNYDIVSE